MAQPHLLEGLMDVDKGTDNGKNIANAYAE